MSQKEKIALHAGYEQCESTHPEAQFIEGRYYRPRYGKDSLQLVLDCCAFEKRAYGGDVRKHFPINVAEA